MDRAWEVQKAAALGFFQNSYQLNLAADPTRHPVDLYCEYSRRHRLKTQPTSRLEVKAPKTHVAGRDPLLDMAVTGHIVHGNEMKSAEFKRFLAQFPEWSYPVGWTASYKNFKF